MRSYIQFNLGTIHDKSWQAAVLRRISNPETGERGG